MPKFIFLDSSTSIALKRYLLVIICNSKPVWNKFAKQNFKELSLTLLIEYISN